MKEKKKTSILSIILVFGLLIIFFTYKYSSKVEYLCLKENTYANTKITKDMLKTCTSRGRTNEKYITKENNVIGKCINTNKRKERLIYPKDIEICSEDREIKTLELKEELTFFNHMSSSENDTEVYTTFYIKDNMLYVSEDNKEDKLLFNMEKVSKITKRNLSPTGDSRILILTDNGNVYISEKDPSYNFNYDKDFYFWKLDAKNIIGFELISNKEDTYNSELYGITKDNKSIRIDEEYQ